MKVALIFILMLLFVKSKVSFVPERLLELKREAMVKNYHPLENEDLIISASDLVEVGAGTETFYFREVFTSVCESDKCYPVRITFYWNLIGDFVGFELPPGEELTKTDHQPFTQAEYEKLNKALNDPYSRLRYYSIGNLVNEPDSGTGVDAISGATNKEVLDIVVEGAVYTFHTLWNLANGPVKKKIKSISGASLSYDVLFQLLYHENPDYIIFAIKAIQERELQNSDFYLRLYELYEFEDEALANFAMNNIPIEILQSSNYQIKIIESLKNSDFSNRVILFNKIKTFKIFSFPLLEYLAVLMHEVDDWQKVQILQIINMSGKMSEIVKGEINKLKKSENRRILKEIETIERDNF